ncbi:MAG: glycosyltransferase family 4 protein [Chloroflexi bacterium]|nr:glycosyltransferase family 4 protein [Chloroflexota bacterium]
MRIAQITSTYLSVPPRSHGGTELMVYHLVEGLVRDGHHVELFASGDSRTSATLQAVVPIATSYDPGMTSYLDKEYETRNTFNLYRQAERFDVIHAHWPTLAPYFSNFIDRPTLLTYAYVERHLHEYYRATFPCVHPVCISRTQAKMLGEDLPVVYNGIDVDNVPFGEQPEDFLVIVGRIVPNKGIAEAIHIAKQACERLLIVGHVPPQLPWSRAYYEEQVRPHIDGDAIRHVEHLPNAEVLRLVSHAKAFLFPLQWEEPFGLAVAEALAAGTPVVAYPKGAMSEIVLDGQNGFLVETDAEAVRALGRIGSISRRACRQSIADRFSLDRMVRAYEALYRHVTVK